MCFINFSNHVHAKWQKEQLDESKKIGETENIIDISFPIIGPAWNEKQVLDTAEKCVDEILSYKPSAVMCQGEFGLTYTVVNLLKSKGILVVYACSKRNVKEEVQEDGSVKKEAIFQFVRYREYY